MIRDIKNDTYPKTFVLTYTKNSSNKFPHATKFLKVIERRLSFLHLFANLTSSSIR